MLRGKNFNLDDFFPTIIEITKRESIGLSLDVLKHLFGTTFCSPLPPAVPLVRMNSQSSAKP